MESVDYKNRILSRKTRWLAALTGCVSGVALLSFSWLCVLGIILIIGAVLQPRVPRAGRWLLYVATPLLSLWVVPTGAVVWVETAKGLSHITHEVIPQGLSLAWIVSPILLIWCNAVLLVEAVKERRTRQAILSLPQA